MIEFLTVDLRRGLRSLRRAPAFAAMAILALALGIGGATTMFSAVNAIFLRPLPYPSSERVVVLWQTRQANRQIPVSMLDFLDWRRQSRSFEHMAAVGASSRNIAGAVGPERVTAGYVTRDLFAALGAAPVLGRTFTVEEAVSNGPKAVVIGHRLWQRLFQGDRGILGKTLSIEGLSFPIVGVMPEWLAFPDGAEIWLPLPVDDGSARSAHNYRVIALLQRDLSLERAQADMDVIATRLARAYPESNAGYGIAVVPLRREIAGKEGRTALLLLGAVLFVLLIACANVANLLLARAVARETETSVRLALGASQAGLIRPFLAESLALAVLGGALGLLLASLGVKGVSRLAPSGILGGSTELELDWRVLLFCFLIALLAGLLCGLAPALSAARQELRTALAAGGRSLAGGQRGMKALVVAEVAVAAVLLVGAGLLLRSARELEAVDPGFRAQGLGLLTFTMGGFSGSPYNDDAWRSRFYSRLLDRVSRLPGVRLAGLINQPPLSGKSYNGTLMIEGEEEATATAHYRLTGGDYFKVMGIPLLRGRAFAVQDRAGAPHVAVVNQSLAREIAPEGEIFDRRVRIPGMDQVEEWATIVGVVADVRHRGVGREPVPEIYFPYTQRPQRSWEMSLVLQTSGEPALLLPQLRDAVRSLDAALPVRFDTMAGLLDNDLAQPRFRARLLGVFAGVALALAAVGIFGVVSYAVGRRNREVGIRMALGASRGAIQSLMLRSGMAPVLAGLLIGLAASLALARLLAGLLFEVAVIDPLVLASVGLILGAAAFVATYLPSRRATRIAPTDALRME